MVGSTPSPASHDPTNSDLPNRPNPRFSPTDVMHYVRRVVSQTGTTSDRHPVRRASGQTGNWSGWISHDVQESSDDAIQVVRFGFDIGCPANGPEGGRRDRADGDDDRWQSGGAQQFDGTVHGRR